MSAGIDYGLGRSNIDNETRIRFGVIAQSSVLQAWADSAEPDYGDATCPDCGNKVIEGDTDDFACESCEETFESDEVYPDEPSGWSYRDEGYELTDCLDSDIFVLKSPYYTYARFCSPCVPGAGDLDSADPDGVRTYCLGHDWFEGGKAPYPVYRVTDGKPVAST